MQLVLLNLALLLALGTAIVVFINSSLRDTIDTLQLQAYEQQAAAITSRLLVHQQRLDATDPHAPDLPTVQQAALIEISREAGGPGDRWPQLLIINGSGTLLLSPPGIDRALKQRLLSELGRGPAGECDLTTPDGGAVWCLVSHFEPWNWRIVQFLDHDSKYADGRHVTTTSILFSLAAFAIAAIVLFLLVRRSLRPIGRLTAAATAMAQGDLTRSVIIASDDEIADLTRSFIIMRQAVLDKIADLEREVREREAATEALSASEENLAITLDSIADAVIAADADGKVTHMNPVAEALSGWAEPAAIGQPIDAIYHLVDADGERPIPGIRRRINERDPELPFDATLVARDGTRRLIDDNPAPIRNQRGDIVGMVLVFRDISERRELEERLRHGERLDAIGQLAGGVAHDFNNMLSGIIGSAELMLEELPDNEAQRGLAGDIIRTGERAADLASKLLTFSRRGRRANSPFDLHSCIQDAITILSRSIDKRIHIETGLLAHSRVILGDQSQMQSALINMGINARDAMPEGGTLRIETGNGDERTSERIGLPPGPCLSLHISDTGQGIDPDILPRIFDPFVTTKGVGEGTGLGLSAVYGCIQEHRGQIEIDSRPGQGCRITIHLPVVSSDATEDPPSEGFRPTPGGSGRVLLVDDEAVVRAVASKMLERIGYEVTIACDGREAVQIFHEDPDCFTAVVLDMVMPHMDGHECLRALRAIRPDMPVLIASGYTRSHLSTSEIHHLDFIAKPYHKAELARALDNLLALHRQQNRGGLGKTI